jgi:hypothetical protein
MAMARIRGKRKPNQKRAIFLAILLIVTVFLFWNMDNLIKGLFK